MKLSSVEDGTLWQAKNGEEHQLIAPPLILRPAGPISCSKAFQCLLHFVSFGIDSFLFKNLVLFCSSHYKMELIYDVSFYTLALSYFSHAHAHTFHKTDKTSPLELKT